MATSGFLTKDNLPYFAVDHDDDGGFTLSQIATSGDVISLLPTFGQLALLKGRRTKAVLRFGGIF